jgi:selenocysteine lyase/cysteine desulfurase
MGVDNILKREKEILDIIWQELLDVTGLHILADNIKERLGVVSFYIEGLHYNLGVKLLNDKFGIQVRGGCSCAGTYGHFLLNVDEGYSKIITDQINVGDLTNKPGWIRMSIHPVMTNDEIYKLTNGVKQLALHFKDWAEDYNYYARSNDFKHKKFDDNTNKEIKDWFQDSYH